MDKALFSALAAMLLAGMARTAPMKPSAFKVNAGAEKTMGMTQVNEPKK